MAYAMRGNDGKRARGSSRRLALIIFMIGWDIHVVRSVIPNQNKL